MKKKYIIIPVAALTVLGIGTGVFLANDKVKLVNDNLVIEAGAELDFDISQYVDASESKLEKLLVDTSKVDTSKVGDYEITITYKKQVLTLKVTVTDTLAPVIEQPQGVFNATVGEEVLIESLALSAKDVSDYKLAFEDGTSVTVFDTGGEVKKKVIATDIYNNTSEIELTFKVADANPPVFEGYGTKDRTVYLENGVDLLDGVFAKDAEDGDITDKIQVSDVDISSLGEKEVTYTVEDSTGNISTLTVKLNIESVIEELDKTMYATSVVTVRSVSNAEGDKLGTLSYAQSVHVTGRDKNTGWYRIEYNGGSAWVSDSYLSNTKPKVKTPSNNSSSTTKKTKPSKTKPSSSDCSSDCTSDCSSDCAGFCNDCDCEIVDPSHYCEDDGNCW